MQRWCAFVLVLGGCGSSGTDAPKACKERPFPAAMYDFLSASAPDRWSALPPGVRLCDYEDLRTHEGAGWFDVEFPGQTVEQARVTLDRAAVANGWRPAKAGDPTISPWGAMPEFPIEPDLYVRPTSDVQRTEAAAAGRPAPPRMVGATYIFAAASASGPAHARIRFHVSYMEPTPDWSK
jgi:hypothetical protein